MVAGHYPESLAQFQKVLERDPAFAPAHYKLSQLYATTGHFADAESEFRKFAPVSGSWSPDAQGYSQMVLAAPNPHDNIAAIAVGFALAGDRNQAFESLEKAFAEENDELIFAIRYPAFDSIRSDPRCADLTRRLGLPE